jgi:hypothetical protein
MDRERLLTWSKEGNRTINGQFSLCVAGPVRKNEPKSPKDENE